MTEEQQIELLKEWWKKNGNFTISVFILAFLFSIDCIFGLNTVK